MADRHALDGSGGRLIRMLLRARVTCLVRAADDLHQRAGGHASQAHEDASREADDRDEHRQDAALSLIHI